MIRRQTRLRKEYLYRKSLETKERNLYDKKKAIKEALKDGKTAPGTVKRQFLKIQPSLQFDTEDEPKTTHVDDEYANAGAHDPKIMVTTSRDPSSRLGQFAKEVRLMFPNSQKINRGGYVIKDIVDACRANNVTDLIILHEHRGEPDGMIISHFPYGPTAYFTLHNVVLRHDIPDRGTVSEQYPHLIFDNFNTPLGERVKSILKYLFPVPKETSERTMTFANKNDFISFRHHVFHVANQKQVELMEVGPRFEMRLYKIQLGTLDIAEADTEWVSRPYLNTAKKRQHL